MADPSDSSPQSTVAATISASFSTLPVPFVILMAAGFVIGGIGHVYKSTTLIVTGIGLIFMATLGLPLGLYLSDR